MIWFFFCLGQAPAEPLQPWVQVNTGEKRMDSYFFYSVLIPFLKTHTNIIVVPIFFFFKEQPLALKSYIFHALVEVVIYSRMSMQRKQPLTFLHGAATWLEHACFATALNVFPQQGAVNHLGEQTTWLFTLQRSSTHAARLSISLVPANVVRLPVLDLGIVCKSILFRGCRWVYL